MSRLSYSGRLPQGGAVTLTVEGTKITAVTPIPGDEKLPWLLPVLVDLQQNGGWNVSFDHAKSVSDFKKVACGLLGHGVGRILPTFCTTSLENLHTAMTEYRKAVESDPVLNAMFYGIFQEGVFISPVEGWRGAHNPKYIRKPNWDELCRLDEASGGRIHMINIAPEEPGAMEFIDHAISAGKEISLGHACPTAAHIREAAKRGARFVTHFGNGAAAMIPRFNNPYWEYLNNEQLRLGLICDGFHLPQEVIQVALKVKGRNNCYVVSDASYLAGCKPGNYTEAGLDVVLEPNGFLHLPNSTLLAGATAHQDRCVEILVNRCGLTFLEAWRQCSEIPAAIAEFELPKQEVGQEASFVLADWHENRVRIHKSVMFGQEWGRQDETAYEK